MVTESIIISTDKREGLYDITARVKKIVKNNQWSQGLASLYVRGATAALMIQENWDQSVQNDVIRCEFDGPRKQREIIVTLI